MRALRSAVLLGLGWPLSMATAAAVTVVGLAVPRSTMRRAGPRMLSAWGHTMLRVSGVRVLVEGREHLARPGPLIVTFNHASALDAYAICTLMPPGSVATVKRELLFYPLVGPAMWALGFVVLDRQHSVRAHRTLAEAAKRIVRERLVVFIAPEGTRSRDGFLRAFKKGVMHLALATGAPIVPVVIEGSFPLQRRGQWWAWPGTVRVRILPAIEHPVRSREEIGPATEALRALYERELAHLGATPAFVASPLEQHAP